MSLFYLPSLGDWCWFINSITASQGSWDPLKAVKAAEWCTNILYILPFKRLGSIWKNKTKKILYFFMNALNWSDMTVKTFMMLHKISISNKCCSFELSIQRIPMYPNVKMYQFPQEYDAAQLFSTWIIIRNVSWAGNQQIIMTSEGSWILKTGVMNSALNISQYYRFIYFYQINAAWCIRDFFQ